MHAEFNPSYNGSVGYGGAAFGCSVGGKISVFPNLVSHDVNGSSPLRQSTKIKAQTDGKHTDLSHLGGDTHRSAAAGHERERNIFWKTKIGISKRHGKTFYQSRTVRFPT